MSVPPVLLSRDSSAAMRDVSSDSRCLAASSSACRLCTAAGATAGAPGSAAEWYTNSQHPPVQHSGYPTEGVLRSAQHKTLLVSQNLERGPLHSCDMDSRCCCRLCRGSEHISAASRSTCKLCYCMDCYRVRRAQLLIRLQALHSTAQRVVCQGLGS